LKLHRSFRFTALNPARVILMFFLAAALSVGIAQQGVALIGAHEALRARILEWTGVPAAGYVTMASFGSENVPALTSPVASYHGKSWLLAAACLIPAVILLAIFARVKLSRSLMVFALALLAISAANEYFQSSATGDSLFFIRFWLRCEFVIWILMPWLMAILTSIITLSWWTSILWMVGASAYAVLWSAVRLAFCAGLLYYSGPVLTLLLWSVFGVLADLLSLCLFYSLAISQGTRRPNG